MVQILVVDDSEFFQQLYANELKKAGFEVEIAMNGEDAIFKMRTLKPRLVFMDIEMPTLNGIDALVKIKQDESIKTTPVVMLTSMSAEKAGEDSLMKGAVAYLTKSDVSAEGVVKKAEEILGTSQAPLDPLRG